MRKIGVFKPGVLCIMAVIMLGGCKKDNTREVLDQEMRVLQQYLETNDITAEPTAAGL